MPSSSKRRFVMCASLCLASVPSLASCVKPTGRLESNRFQHEHYPYAVFYGTDGTAESPVGPGYLIDHLRENEHGELVPKSEAGYRVERRYDLNQDGRAELDRDQPRCDLSLRRLGGDTQLFVRTIPLGPDDQGLSLSALADRYLADVAHTGEVAPAFGVEKPDPSLDADAALSDVRHSACTLSARPAERVDFRLGGTPKRPQRMGSLVFVESGYVETVDVGRRGVAPRDYPVLMVLGLSASPLERDARESDFDRLLSHTVLGEVGQGLSMKGSTTCTQSRPPADATAGNEPPP